MVYQRLIRPLLFLLPVGGRASCAGALAMGLLTSLPGLARGPAGRLAPRDPALLAPRSLGRELPGPLGLAAGFDKDAEGVDALLALGFGFVEVGTVTARGAARQPEAAPVPAAARPRARQSHGLQQRRRRARRPQRAVAAAAHGTVGVNIGKTKRVAEAEALADFTRSAQTLAPLADYLVVNVSSPNTPGLRDLQAVDKLRPLLAAVRAACDLASPMRRVPLLVKIAPDLADADIDAIADLALELGLDGIIATNTTIARTGLRRPRRTSRRSAPAACRARRSSARSLDVLRRLRARRPATSSAY